MSTIAQMFTDPKSKAFKNWHSWITILIFASCFSLSLETVPGYSEAYQDQFRLMEWISVVFFSLDYVGNIAYAKSKIGYIFSFWGLVDLISILPSIVMLLNMAVTRGTKVLRLLRVARILRVLKLSRGAIDDLKKSSGSRTDTLAANLKIYAIILFSALMISSTAMYFIEGSLYVPEVMEAGQHAIDIATPEGVKPELFVPVDPISGNQITADKQFFTSIPTAMWWCMVTLTTTGYGDMYPTSVGGRLVAVVTMFAGLVLFGLLMDIVRTAMMAILFGEGDAKK